VAWLHFVICAEPQLFDYNGHWRSLPDYANSKE
jgi:hypothetical protein